MRLHWYDSGDWWGFSIRPDGGNLPTRDYAWSPVKSVDMEDRDWRRYGIDPVQVDNDVRQQGFFVVRKPEGVN